MTHATSRDCHGHNKCKITSEPSQLGATDCNSNHVLLNITFVCVLSENFNPEFLMHINSKESNIKTFDVQKFEQRRIEQINENKNSMFGSKDMHDLKDSVVNSEEMLKVNKHPHFKKEENISILMGYESHSTNSSKIFKEI